MPLFDQASLAYKAKILQAIRDHYFVEAISEAIETCFEGAIFNRTFLGSAILVHARMENAQLENVAYAKQGITNLQHLAQITTGIWLPTPTPMRN